MEKVIWKFPLTTTRPIQMPKGAEIMYIGVQQDNIFVWAKVKPHLPKEDRHFKAIDTGQSFHDDYLTYIGTASMDDGDTVHHIFEISEKE